MAMHTSFLSFCCFIAQLLDLCISVRSYSFQDAAGFGKEELVVLMLGVFVCLADWMPACWMHTPSTTLS